MGHKSDAEVLVTYGAPTPHGTMHTLIDGGDMDCGSGLLLLITRSMRRMQAGDLLGVRSQEPSVNVDLPVWAELVGHEISGSSYDEATGAWWFAVAKSGAPIATTTVFSQGVRTPVGSRIWVYTNFDCNLACGYCCAESSPKAPARRMPVETVAAAMAEFAQSGGKQVFFTGGEPFMHPELKELLDSAAGFERTILTNAMIFGRGTRRETLESLDRSVVLQVSLDSATPELHDKQRGLGSWARALTGIELAKELGFRVRIAATLFDEDPIGVAALHERLEAVGIALEDRVIRPVAQEGFADSGIPVSIDSLEPEPTITADGAWWHPVAVTNPHMRIADAPLPLSEVFGVVSDTLSVQDAAASSGREVFRCA